MPPHLLLSILLFGLVEGAVVKNVEAIVIFTSVAAIM
jgi:hypothetical protein